VNELRAQHALVDACFDGSMLGARARQQLPVPPRVPHYLPHPFCLDHRCCLRAARHVLSLRVSMARCLHVTPALLLGPVLVSTTFPLPPVIRQLWAGITSPCDAQSWVHARLNLPTLSYSPMCAGAGGPAAAHLSDCCARHRGVPGACLLGCI